MLYLLGVPTVLAALRGTTVLFALVVISGHRFRFFCGGFSFAFRPRLLPRPAFSWDRVIGTFL